MSEIGWWLRVRFGIEPGVRSRGLSKKEAVSVLKQAFLTEITDLIKIDLVRNKVEQMLIDKFLQLSETTNELLN